MADFVRSSGWPLQVYRCYKRNSSVTLLCRQLRAFSHLSRLRVFYEWEVQKRWAESRSEGETNSDRWLRDAQTRNNNRKEEGTANDLWLNFMHTTEVKLCTRTQFYVDWFTIEWDEMVEWNPSGKQKGADYELLISAKRAPFLQSISFIVSILSILVDLSCNLTIALLSLPMMAWNGLIQTAFYQFAESHRGV